MVRNSSSSKAALSNWPIRCGPPSVSTSCAPRRASSYSPVFRPRRVVALGLARAGWTARLPQWPSLIEPARSARPRAASRSPTRRRPHHQGPRRRRRRLLQGLPVPEGRVPQAAARRPRPPAHADGPRTTERSARRPGTRRSRSIAEKLPPLLDAARARRVRGLPRQPLRRTALAPLLYGRSLLKAIGHEEHLLGVDRRPVPQADGVRR